MAQIETIQAVFGDRARDTLRTVLAVALLAVALATGALSWMP